MEKRKGGFTIIELIVVMTIILILAGLITGAAQKAKQQAMVAKARSMIAGLETSLGMFQADTGIYPATGNLYSNLTSSAGLTTAQAANWAGPYMNFQTNEVNTVAGTILDPWNNAYHYANTGAAAHGFDHYIDIWSNGPNKVDNSGAGDDVTNWRR
ncbi:MAG: type II secretion system protein GspG [Candidatus Omnitrophica bacterium]|nr:type II secretion system protein GspG [Candidatus Omnitrophota bacterium]MDD5310752.1 type II secretion system protein GspG [Candidatus Omnitrophota bacterium]MDD5545565.1 type II secretion system protein GspG [Candidatus Omnitrophota bacterium]